MDFLVVLFDMLVITVLSLLVLWMTVARWLGSPRFCLSKFKFTSLKDPDAANTCVARTFFYAAGCSKLFPPRELELNYASVCEWMP